MILKPLALSASLAVAGVVAAAGYSHADHSRFASRSPDTVLALASAKLALNPAQQDQLRPLLLRAAALRSDIRSKTEALRSASRAELARPDADLRALDAERRTLVTSELKAVDDLRGQFLGFYEHDLSPAQQAQARQLMLQRMDRVDRLRDRLLAFAEAAPAAPDAP
jgi:hypothetical protein